jgi:hypothetical protein
MSIIDIENMDKKNIQKVIFYNFYSEKQNKVVKYPIDINYINKLCTDGILNDAVIFKYLFGLEIPSNNFKIDKDYSYDFSKYDITFEEWMIFIKFIKYHILLNDDIDKLILISNKFGGIPFVDIYLQNKEYNLNIIPENYNPQLPKEDYLSIYKWITCMDKDLSHFQGMNESYSACGFLKINAVTIIHYFRKICEKKNVSKNNKEIIKFKIDNLSDNSNKKIENKSKLKYTNLILKTNDISFDDMYDFRKDTVQ